MTKDLRTASLLDFVPESIASDPDIIALSLALDPELQDVAAAIVEAVILPNIANLPDAILDELAWAFQLNDLQIWDSAPTDGKRALLANIYAIRKKSGTRYSVRRVFDLLSVVGEVVEWFEEGAQPHTYRLMLTSQDPGVTEAQLVQIRELTRRFARKSQKLSQFAVQYDSTGPLYTAAAVTIGRQTTIPFGGP